MNTKRPKGLLFEPEIEQKLKEIARLIAEQDETDEDKAFRMLRRDMHRIFVELEQSGESEMLGAGILKREKDGSIKLHKYPEEIVKMKQQLRLQQQYGGETGNIGDQPVREFNVQMSADSAIKERIEQMAEYKGVPADELKQLFWKQMEQAYDELIEKGVGCLPDFGYIRFAGEKLRKLEFDFNKEVAALFEEHREE